MKGFIFGAITVGVANLVARNMDQIRKFAAITQAKDTREDIGDYDQRFKVALDSEVKEHDQATTDSYYDLATDFYEYGWGSSFHFAPRVVGETLKASILRHEHWLAAKLGLKRGMKVADLGMGVGGPLRQIARFSGAEILGVTINKYQVSRARKLALIESTPEERSRTSYLQSDYTDLKAIPDESFDAVYYIESSCHVTNRTEAWAEAHRVLKPHGRLFSYEWVMTENFDKANEEHLRIKRGIEHGDGINNLITVSEMLSHLEPSGFKLLEGGDVVQMALVNGEEDVPWYEPLQAGWSLSQFPMSRVGRAATTGMLTVTDAVGLTKGAKDTQTMLQDAGYCLVEGGELQLFTPMYYILAEKL